MYWAGEFGSEYARICNDEMSAYCRQDPQHFDFWCHANLAEPEAAVQEIERAVTQLGAKGVCVGGTNFNGIETHDERLFPVWEKIEKLDVPIMVHGFNQSIYWVRSTPTTSSRPPRSSATASMKHCSSGT